MFIAVCNYIEKCGECKNICFNVHYIAMTVIQLWPYDTVNCDFLGVKVANCQSLLLYDADWQSQSHTSCKWIYKYNELNTKIYVKAKYNMYKTK